MTLARTLTRSFVAVVALAGACPAESVALGAALLSTGCQIIGPASAPPTTSLRLRGNLALADAHVTIDDIPLGSLAYVAQHGVALPPGRHRITVEKVGYFPWDALVDAAERPIQLQVAMVPIPD